MPAGAGHLLGCIVEVDGGHAGARAMRARACVPSRLRARACAALRVRVCMLAKTPVLARAGPAVPTSSLWAHLPRTPSRMGSLQARSHNVINRDCEQPGSPPSLADFVTSEGRDCSHRDQQDRFRVGLGTIRPRGHLCGHEPRLAGAVIDGLP